MENVIKDEVMDVEEIVKDNFITERTYQQIKKQMNKTSDYFTVEEYKALKKLSG